MIVMLYPTGGYARPDYDCAVGETIKCGVYLDTPPQDLPRQEYDRIDVSRLVRFLDASAELDVDRISFLHGFRPLPGTPDIGIGNGYAPWRYPNGDIRPVLAAIIYCTAQQAGELTISPVQVSVTLDGEELVTETRTMTITVTQPLLPHERGDMNEDGAVDLADVNAFTRAVQGGSMDEAARALADMNEDGVVDVRDVRLFVRRLQRGG